MLLLQQLSYTHPDKELLFDSIYLSLGRQDKVALVGPNGSGKSTLLKIMAGYLLPSAGTIHTDAPPYYVPQHFGQYNHLTAARALRVEEKRNALQAILGGQATEGHWQQLGDDWTIEERCAAALHHWGLEGLDLNQGLDRLSGGQKTRLFLAGTAIHQPDLVLLDEPSNHLDASGRQLLYDFIQATSATLLIVSHDRTLLNLLQPMYELGPHGITVYGGNYDFYRAQKAAGHEALHQEVREKEKALRKAKEVARETAERKQRQDARGKKKQEKAGLPTISLNTLRNNAERSTARLKEAHAGKLKSLSEDLTNLRKELPGLESMKFGFRDSALHAGKRLVKAENLRFRFGTLPLWPEGLHFELLSGERVALNGANGSGKTTLIRLLLGELQPAGGTLYLAPFKAVYIDQEYALIGEGLSVYEQAQRFNSSGLQEHEVKIRLARFLFPQAFWNQPCAGLSGGEKMRLLLCGLTMREEAPDLVILDEPTNNLDIQNIEILTAAMNAYEGTLLVVTHDQRFREEIGVQRSLHLA